MRTRQRPQKSRSNASAAGDLQTTLQVAGVDCAEEVSLIQRALKPLGGVREVRVTRDGLLSGLPPTMITSEKTTYEYLLEPGCLRPRPRRPPIPR